VLFARALIAHGKSPERIRRVTCTIMHRRRREIEALTSRRSIGNCIGIVVPSPGPSAGSDGPRYVPSRASLIAPARRIRPFAFLEQFANAVLDFSARHVSRARCPLQNFVIQRRTRTASARDGFKAAAISRRLQSSLGKRHRLELGLHLS
jgi:hypothetical protein